MAPRVLCRNAECVKGFENTSRGHIDAYKDGWFHEHKDGDSWCPDHKPSWVDNWWLKRKLV